MKMFYRSAGVQAISEIKDAPRSRTSLARSVDVVCADRHWRSV